jgi:hypothetical protein
MPNLRIFLSKFLWKAPRLATLKPSKDDTLALDLLSNNACRGIDEKRLPSSELLGEDCTYHSSEITAAALAMKKTW